MQNHEKTNALKLAIGIRAVLKETWSIGFTKAEKVQVGSINSPYSK